MSIIIESQDYALDTWMAVQRTNLEGQIIDARPALKRGLIWRYENLDIFTVDNEAEGRRDVLTLESRQGTRGVGRRMGKFQNIERGWIPDVPEYPYLMYIWKTEDLKVTRRHAIKDFNRKHPQVKKDLEAKKQLKLRF